MLKHHILPILLLALIAIQQCCTKSIVKRDCCGTCQNSCASSCQSNCNTYACQASCNSCRQSCSNNCQQACSVINTQPTCLTCNNNNNCNNCNNNNNCRDNNCASPEPVLVPFPPSAEKQIIPASSGSTSFNQSNYYNHTSEINIDNVVNLTNNISVPININSTNQNYISVVPANNVVERIKDNIVVTEKPNNPNCCYVIHPVTCTGGVCTRRRTWECNELCTAGVWITDITQPPVTQPPVTQPPIIQPPIIQPPIIQPPIIQPRIIQPPIIQPQTGCNIGTCPYVQPPAPVVCGNYPNCYYQTGTASQYVVQQQPQYTVQQPQYIVSQPQYTAQQSPCQLGGQCVQ